ncbi:hypothetical protein [Persicitalea jodogahamensis]|nr:hypothetical protein [Persicitalea jodogahamensis]
MFIKCKNPFLKALWPILRIVLIGTALSLLITWLTDQCTQSPKA